MRLQVDHVDSGENPPIIHERRRLIRLTIPAIGAANIEDTTGWTVDKERPTLSANDRSWLILLADTLDSHIGLTMKALTVDDRGNG